MKTMDVNNLSKEDVQRLPRAHALFYQWVEEVLMVYEQHRDVLFIADFDPDDVRAALASWQAERATERELEKQLIRVRTKRLYWSATVWSAMLKIYLYAKAVARTNGDVARAIKGFAAYLATGKRKKSVATDTSG